MLIASGMSAFSYLMSFCDIDWKADINNYFSIIFYVFMDFFMYL